MGVAEANTAGNVHGGVILHETVRTGEVTHTSTAYLKMVALDDEGRPAAVPPVRPVMPDEERRAREAQLRRDNRLDERRRIESAREGR